MKFIELTLYDQERSEKVMLNVDFIVGVHKPSTGQVGATIELYHSGSYNEYGVQESYDYIRVALANKGLTI